MSLNSFEFNGMRTVDSSPAFLTFDQIGVLTTAEETLPVKVFIYKITNTVNGKAYVGLTCNTVEKRWAEHIAEAAYAKTQRVFINAIRKYGAGAFVVETLCEVEGVPEACLVERDMIAQYNTLLPDGYNMTTGGEGLVGKRLTEELRGQISENVKKLWADPDYRARAMLAMQDRIMPDSHVEHLRRLAAEQKGKPRKLESVAKGRAKLMGHAVSEETRIKIGNSRRGKLRSEESKKAWSEKLRKMHADGVFSNPQRSEKIRQAKLALWADPEWRASRTGVKRGPYKNKKCAAAVKED